MTAAYAVVKATPSKLERRFPRTTCAAPGLAEMAEEFIRRRQRGTTSIDQHALWLIDIAILVACRASSELLESHVEAALEQDVTRSEIIDAVVEAAIYAGLSAAEEALSAVRRVFTVRDLAGPVDVWA